MNQPTKSQRNADAYRRDIMDAATRARYEEAVRRGIVNDPYAAAFIGGTDPFTGSLTTAARGVPGLTELGAGYAAALSTADDAINGRPLELGDRWNEARAAQQGVADRFRQDHPIASNAAAALGEVAPGMISVPMLARPAQVAAALAPTRGLAPALARFGERTAQGALAGATGGAVSGLGQPGTLDQRAAAANAAMGPGAIGGAVIPVAGAAAGNVARGAAVLMRRGEQQVGRGFASPQTSSSAPKSREDEFPYNLIPRGFSNFEKSKADLDVYNPYWPSVTSEGVDLTLGQRVGGYARTIENHAMGLPVVGPAIRARRAEALASFNRVNANRTLAELGESQPATVKPGNDSAAYLRSRVYSRVDGMTVWPDYDYNEDRETPPGAPPALPLDSQKQYRSITDNVMANAALRDDENDQDFDGYSGKEALEILDHLRDFANNHDLQGGGGAQLGAELEKFGDQVRALTYRQQPEYIDDFSRADKANELRVLIARATNAAGENGGIYTPEDLMAVIRARYSGVGANWVPSAVADLYQFADRARQAMGPQYSGNGATSSMPTEPKAPPASLNAGLRALTGDGPGTAAGPANAFTSPPLPQPYIAMPNGARNAFGVGPVSAPARLPPTPAAIAAGVGARNLNGQNDQDQDGSSGPR